MGTDDCKVNIKNFAQENRTAAELNKNTYTGIFGIEQILPNAKRIKQEVKDSQNTYLLKFKINAYFSYTLRIRMKSKLKWKTNLLEYLESEPNRIKLKVK